MLNVDHLRTEVIRPVLEQLGHSFSSLAAENLLIGTALQESGLRHLRQIRGPALGIYQIEPFTLDDLYINFFRYNKGLMIQVDKFKGIWPDKYESLIGNLYYATAVARMQYYRHPFKLPDHDDVEGLARIWKRYWNTEKGKGTTAQFILNYRTHNV